MANQDWSNLGDEIKNLVQSAVDSQNFKQLNETIGKTINDAMENVNLGLNKAGDKINEAGDRLNHKTREYENKYKKVNVQHPWEGKQASRKNEIYDPGTRVLYKNPAGMTAVGTILAATGYLLSGGMGIGALIVFLVGLVTGAMMAGQVIALGVLLPLIIGSGIMAGIGSKILRRAKRFKSYIRELKGRDFCSIRELAQSIGKSESFVLKDVRDMLGRNMFRQGHLDKQQSCLMVTDEAFRQYQNVQLELEERQRIPEPVKESIPEKAKKMQEAVKEEKLSAEVRKIIQEGKAYIEQIHKSNAAIKGEEMSAKITRMEFITQKIFSRVEQQPELVTDLHKFMGYYLPTTVKLLSAYEELDAQSIQGPNILSSKKEIEETLDTINQAFEKLLDSFFQDKAWDISSDISVLQTMLAQEGLMSSDFEV